VSDGLATDDIVFAAINNADYDMQLPFIVV
jgi:hypothetical protein